MSSEPFDPQALRLAQDFSMLAPVKKILMQVPVRRPDPQQFFRVHSDPQMRLEPAAVLELTDRQESYLVVPRLYSQVANEVKVKVLFLAITRTGVVFLWPVALPDADGRMNPWSRSAMLAAEHAMTRWTRIRSNRVLGGYDIEEPGAVLPEPEWPEELTLARAIELAFRDRLIDTPDHPVLRQLRGQF
jgi:hypothetical protein